MRHQPWLLHAWKALVQAVRGGGCDRPTLSKRGGGSLACLICCCTATDPRLPARVSCCCLQGILFPDRMKGAVLDKVGAALHACMHAWQMV